MFTPFMVWINTANGGNFACMWQNGRWTEMQCLRCVGAGYDMYDGGVLWCGEVWCGVGHYLLTHFYSHTYCSSGFPGGWKVKSFLWRGKNWQLAHFSSHTRLHNCIPPRAWNHEKLCVRDGGRCTFTWSSLLYNLSLQREHSEVP